MLYQLTFEQFCLARDFELTDQYRKIWKSWSGAGKLIYVGSAAGLRPLTKMMNDYDQYLKEESVAKKKEPKKMERGCGLPEKLNGNTLAKFVADNEGGKVELPISQIKEVIKLIGIATAKRPVEMLNLLYKLGQRNA